MVNTNSQKGDYTFVILSKQIKNQKMSGGASRRHSSFGFMS
jgi:hypothetical protein